MAVNCCVCPFIYTSFCGTIRASFKAYFMGRGAQNDEGQKPEIKTLIFGENNAGADRRHAFSFDVSNYS